MTYKLSSGRRYLNGELVDPPQLGGRTESDFFPVFDHDDFTDAGLFEIEMDADEWDAANEWLHSIDSSAAPLYFMIEQTYGRVEWLPRDLQDTRMKEFPAIWVNAYRQALKAAPTRFLDALCFVIAKAIRAERERRKAAPEQAYERRSTLTFFRPGQ